MAIVRAPNMVQRCSHCKQSLPVDQFWVNQKTQKRSKTCRSCENKQRRERRLINLEHEREMGRKWMQGRTEKSKEERLRKFGLTLEQYKLILTSQKGLCALCGKPETESPGKVLRSLAVDHQPPELTQVRALLCSKCNKGLGAFDENPELFRKAASYLEYWQKYYA